MRAHKPGPEACKAAIHPGGGPTRNLFHSHQSVLWWPERGYCAGAGTRPSAAGVSPTEEFLSTKPVAQLGVGATHGMSLAPARANLMRTLAAKISCGVVEHLANFFAHRRRAAHTFAWVASYVKSRTGALDPRVNQLPYPPRRMMGRHASLGRHLTEHGRQLPLVSTHGPMVVRPPVGVDSLPSVSFPPCPSGLRFLPFCVVSPV